jgi:metal-responsive CopG/Arc/MetJ family transcriptional regulator
MTKRKPIKITVLLDDAEFERFDNYCRERGYKKSTLIARMIRNYLDMEGYGAYGGGMPPRPMPPRSGR